MDTSPHQRFSRKVSASTLPRSRSSSNTLTRKKDLSVDEDSALNDMHRRVSGWEYRMSGWVALMSGWEAQMSGWL